MNKFPEPGTYYVVPKSDFISAIVMYSIISPITGYLAVEEWQIAVIAGGCALIPIAHIWSSNRKNTLISKSKS